MARRSKVINPLSRRLLAARLDSGLSQSQLGVLAGLDPTVASARINQYERGAHQPKFPMAAALAKVLEVPTAYLFCLEDELAAWIVERYRAGNR